MYGYVLIVCGGVLLTLATILRGLAVRAVQRKMEEHTRRLIETYGRECYHRAITQGKLLPAGKEVAS